MAVRSSTGASPPTMSYPTLPPDVASRRSPISTKTSFGPRRRTFSPIGAMMARASRPRTSCRAPRTTSPGAVRASSTLPQDVWHVRTWHRRDLEFGRRVRGGVLDLRAGVFGVRREHPRLPDIRGGEQHPPGSDERRSAGYRARGSGTADTERPPEWATATIVKEDSTGIWISSVKGVGTAVPQANELIGGGFHPPRDEESF